MGQPNPEVEAYIDLRYGYQPVLISLRSREQVLNGGQGECPFLFMKHYPARFRRLRLVGIWNQLPFLGT